MGGVSGTTIIHDYLSNKHHFFPISQLGGEVSTTISAYDTSSIWGGGGGGGRYTIHNDLFNNPQFKIGEWSIL